MTISQLPDGSWATSPMYMGFGLKTPCESDEKHEWETQPGSKAPIPEGEKGHPEGVTHMSYQVCKKCSYQRVLLTKEA